MKFRDDSFIGCEDICGNALILTRIHSCQNFNSIGLGVSEPQVVENRYLPLTGGVALTTVYTLTCYTVMQLYYYCEFLFFFWPPGGGVDSAPFSLDYD